MRGQLRLRTGRVITHHTRKAFEKALGMSAAQVGLRTVYEVGLIRLQTTSTKSQSFAFDIIPSNLVLAFRAEPKYKAPVDHEKNAM